MRLYHGSNQGIEKPKLFPAARGLDFGNGFYLTSDFEQAKKWSILTVKRRGEGSPIVSVFKVDEEKLNQLNILRFDGPNVEWLRYVSSNRKSMNFNDRRDIVVGPVANDNTMPVLNLYLKGAYNEDEAIKRLMPQKLKDQYVFKTEEAVSILKLIEVIKI